MSQGVLVSSKLGKVAKQTDYPRASRRERALLLLSFEPRETIVTSDLQNYKLMHSCCFKPLSLQ